MATGAFAAQLLGTLQGDTAWPMALLALAFAAAALVSGWLATGRPRQ
jgi:hypothetical protein